MKTTHFNKVRTAESMNETLQRKFGQKLDIQNFSDEQLHRANSLIETKISEIRKSKFNETLTNEEFHRLKMMHDVVKTALEERAVSKSQQKFMGMVHAAKKGEKPASKEVAKVAKSMTGKEAEKFAKTKHKGLPEKKKKTESVSEAKKAKPDFLDIDKDGNKKEPMKKAVQDKKSKAKKSMAEALDRLVMITEGEEAKAEIIMSVRNMVDRFTAWSEDIAKMQAQTAMELADEIRDQMGQEVAEMFIQSVEPALGSALEGVKSARESLNGTITVLTGESNTPMGAEPEEEPAPETDEMPEPDAQDQEGGEEKIDIDLDELPPEPEGRAKRESIEQRIRITRMLVGS
jgi:hypothetical protein